MKKLMIALVFIVCVGCANSNQQVEQNTNIPLPPMLEIKEERKYENAVMNSNLLWGGNFMEDGESLFYSPNNVGYGGASNAFYRISLSNGATTQISEDNAFFISSLEEKIYYLGKDYYFDEELESAKLFGIGVLRPSGIYSINKDGTNKELLFESESINAMVIINSGIWISEADGTVYELDESGLVRSTIAFPHEAISNSSSLQFDNEYLYSVNLIDHGDVKTHHIARLNLDDKQTIETFSFYASDSFNSGCIIAGGYIFFDSPKGLVRADFLGNEEIVIEKEVNTFLVTSDYIFLCLTEGIYDGKAEIIKISTDDWMETDIISIFEPDDYSMTTINLRAIISDYIYFAQNMDGGDTFDVMKIDFNGDNLSSVLP